MSVKAMNFKMDDQQIKDMKQIASIFHITMTDIVKEAVNEYLAKMKKDPYYRLTVNVEEASPEESEEILKAVNAMSDDDLTIVSEKKFTV